MIDNKKIVVDVQMDTSTIERGVAKISENIGELISKTKDVRDVLFQGIQNNENGLEDIENVTANLSSVMQKCAGKIEKSFWLLINIFCVTFSPDVRGVFYFPK